MMHLTWQIHLKRYILPARDDLNPYSISSHSHAQSSLGTSVSPPSSILAVCLPQLESIHSHLISFLHSTSTLSACFSCEISTWPPNPASFTRHPTIQGLPRSKTTVIQPLTPTQNQIKSCVDVNVPGPQSRYAASSYAKLGTQLSGTTRGRNQVEHCVFFTTRDHFSYGIPVFRHFSNLNLPLLFT